MFVTESRAVNFFLNIYKFVMTIAILYSPNKTNWMISAVLIFVPYAFVRSLNFVIIFGKAMDIQDRDLIDALTCGMAPPEPIRLKKSWTF